MNRLLRPALIKKVLTSIFPPVRTANLEYQQRFGGVERLLGAQNAERLRAARFCVIGVGGVGSWAVEALARSGVGAITLVDLDDVCITNVNRQLPALDGQIGRPKVEVLRERMQAIDPGCAITTLPMFYTKGTSDAILSGSYDCVLDAIDVLSHKCELLADCHRRGLPVVTTGGAGGKMEPSRIRVSDLAETRNDNLLRYVRKRLRSEFGFPGKGSFGIRCVFSEEDPVLPWESEECGLTPADGTRLDCAGGLGAATFVTGVFGFMAAREAIRAALERREAGAP